jgi:hypothetical protein
MREVPPHEAFLSRESQERITKAMNREASKRRRWKTIVLVGAVVVAGMLLYRMHHLLSVTRMKGCVIYDPWEFVRFYTPIWIWIAVVVFYVTHGEIQRRRRRRFFQWD